MRMTVEEFLEIQDILRVTYDLEEPAAGGSRSVNTESKTPAVQEPVAAGSGSVDTDQESIRRAPVMLGISRITWKVFQGRSIMFGHI